MNADLAAQAVHLGRQHPPRSSGTRATAAALLDQLGQEAT